MIMRRSVSALAVALCATVLPAPAHATSALTDESRLRQDGVGPVDVGMTLDEASEAAGTPIAVPEGADPACAHAWAEDGPEGLSFMVTRDEDVDDWRIVRVEVDDDSPILTDQDVGLGATEADVEAAYEDADPNGKYAVEPHKYDENGHYLTYDTDGEGGYLLLFETDGETVQNFRSGFQESVELVEGCL